MNINQQNSHTTKEEEQQLSQNQNHPERDTISASTLDSRFNQTLRNVQGLLKGRSIPGKILLTRRAEPIEDPSLHSPSFGRSLSQNDAGTSDHMHDSIEVEDQDTTKPNNGKLKSTSSNIETMFKESQKSTMGARATDSARVMKFTKELSGSMVILHILLYSSCLFIERLRELAWSGVPPYMHPTIWRLLLGYAPPNSDGRQGVLRRKRSEYLDRVAQFYDIPDTECSYDEINMLRQIAVDCPRTVPDVTFCQQAQVQKSLERILYT